MNIRGEMWTCPYCGKDWSHAEIPETVVCCGESGHLECSTFTDRRVAEIKAKPIQEWTMDEMVYVLMHSPRAYTAYPPDSYFDLEPESRTNEDMENASFERGRDRK